MGLISMRSNLTWQGLTTQAPGRYAPENIQNKISSFQEADININDEYWFPHSTMDLIHISDLVITFGSLAIKECLMLKTKIINFDVKPFKLLPELYTGNFCVDIKDKNYTEDDLIKYHSLLENINNFEFDEYIKKYMFPPNSSKRILDLCQSV